MYSGISRGKSRDIFVDVLKTPRDIRPRRTSTVLIFRAPIDETRHVYMRLIPYRFIHHSQTTIEIQNTNLLSYQLVYRNWFQQTDNFFYVYKNDLLVMI